MPAKRKPVCELGWVRRHGNSWRVECWFDRSCAKGSSRSSREGALADLEHVRAATGREGARALLRGLHAKQERPAATGHAESVVEESSVAGAAGDDAARGQSGHAVTTRASGAGAEPVLGAKTKGEARQGELAAPSPKKAKQDASEGSLGDAS